MPGHHHYVIYSDEEKAKLCWLMEKVKLPREYVFFGHRDDQYVGGGLKGNHRLTQHLYLNPGAVDLQDAVAFVRGDSMQCEERNPREAVLGNVETLYLSDEKNADDDNVPRNTITVEMTRERDKNSAMDVWPAYAIDALIEED